MKNTKVLALRIIGSLMLVMGIIGMVRGSTAATACFCGAASLINASNWIVRKSR